MVDTEPHRMRVESFNLDHRTVAAPYVRLADRKKLSGGSTISKYDIRFTQPNVAHLESDAVHSIEHMFAEFSRAHSDHVIDFSPMGCRTGFYLILDGEPAIDEVVDLVDASMHDILTADSVPAATETQCGWAAHHTLEGAQAAVREFLAKRDEWPSVFSHDGADAGSAPTPA